VNDVVVIVAIVVVADCVVLLTTLSILTLHHVPQLGWSRSLLSKSPD
jgi:hypothetical protein